MTGTVIALMRDRAAAQALAEALVQGGFDAAAIETRSLAPAAAASHPRTTEPRAGSRVESTIEHLARSAFGFEENVGRYANAGAGSAFTITLHAADAAAAGRARALIAAQPGFERFVD